MIVRNKFIIIALALLFSMSCKQDAMKGTTARAQQASFFTMEDGMLVRPTNYRTWVFVGTPVTPNDLNGGKASFPEMHNVYIDPVAYDHYKTTGLFPDGTILIKELVDIGATVASSGKGYFEGEFIGLEAEVKSKEHFPNEPGNWAIFSFGNPETGILKDKAELKPTAACTACHVANAEDDNVFTQFYPVLRAAKGVGADVVPENSAKRFAENHRMKDMVDVADKKKKIGIWTPMAPSPESIEGIPLEEEKLFKWLQDGTYRNWKIQEKEIHKSAGPHADVKTYLNDKIAASLDAKNKEHPVGAVAVKEMYKDGKPFGYSIMVKTADQSDGGKGWFWYESHSTTDIKEKITIGNGVAGCAVCHSIGKDMVRIKYPFK